MPDYTGPQRTVGNVLRNAVALWDEQTWLIVNDEQVSFRDMAERSATVAAGLLQQGIGLGDTVLVMLPNSVEFVAVWLGLARIGAIQVPVNSAYRGRILANIVNDSLARTIIIESEHLETLAAVKPELEHLQQLIVYAECAGGTPELPEPLAQQCRSVPFAELLRGSSSALPPEPCHRDLVGIMYTSGTTGPSKGVMVTHAHAYQYAAGDNALRLGPGDIYYAPLPMFHIAGQWAVIYNCLIRGATAVIKRRFSITDFWGDIDRHGVTTTFLLGAMGSFLFRSTSRERHTSLKKVLMSPLIPELNSFRRRFGVEVCTAYGSTEVNGCIATDLSPPNARTCGRVRTDKFDVKLVDDDDVEVPLGQVGELVVRPREPWIVMAGYWNRPQDTVAAWRNLWLHSGDLMCSDADGYYYFVDRSKDAIRRRGENISSREVETEINAHSAVLESAVFGIDSEHTEQEVMAAVVLRQGETLSPETLIGFLEPRMPRFMLPRYVQMLDELPRTPTGKIQKFELRARGPRLAWDRTAGRPTAEALRTD